MHVKHNGRTSFYYQEVRPLWTRRESNPRPNEEAICFLHAYHCLGFRAQARPVPPTYALSSKNFIPIARPTGTISDFSAPPVQDASERLALGWCLVPAPCAGIKPIYYTSIKQREQTCFRQLNCWKPRLKCPLSGALRAYIPPRPAVKSSLARFFKRSVGGIEVDSVWTGKAKSQLPSKSRAKVRLTF